MLDNPQGERTAEWDKAYSDDALGGSDAAEASKLMALFDKALVAANGLMMSRVGEPDWWATRKAVNVAHELR